MDEHARRMIAGAVNGSAPVGGPPRELVNLQQPDGSTVTIPIEQAILHLLTEVRQMVQDVRAIVVDAEVVSMEAEEITRGADGGADTEATG